MVAFVISKSAEFTVIVRLRSELSIAIVSEPAKVNLEKSGSIEMAYLLGRTDWLKRYGDGAIAFCTLAGNAAPCAAYGAMSKNAIRHVAFSFDIIDGSIFLFNTLF